MNYLKSANQTTSLTLSEDTTIQVEDHPKTDQSMPSGIKLCESACWCCAGTLAVGGFVTGTVFFMLNKPEHISWPAWIFVAYPAAILLTAIVGCCSVCCRASPMPMGAMSSLGY